MEPWWTSQQAGLIGGLGGAAIGLVGAGIGCMSALVARGRGKRVMIGIFSAMIALGVVLLGAGIVAVSGGQPYHVWYPLLLGGLLCTVLFGALMPVIVMRYRAAEARRLQAEQLRRG